MKHFEKMKKLVDVIGQLKVIQLEICLLKLLMKTPNKRATYFIFNVVLFSIQGTKKTEKWTSHLIWIRN